MISRPITVSVFYLLLISCGIASFYFLPVNFLPEFKDARIDIITECGTSSPKEVEMLVSSPIEMQAVMLGEVRSVTSVSRQGESVVTVVFDWKADLTSATLDLREKLDNLSVNLPSFCKKPVISSISFNQSPVMQVAISGNNINTSLLDNLRNRLLLSEGTALVETFGEKTEQINMVVSKERLNSLNIPLSSVEDAIRNSEFIENCGMITENDRTIALEVVSVINSVDALKAINIAEPDGSFIPLKEVAEVGLITASSDIVHINGKEAVLLHIYKEAEANIVSTCRELRKTIATISNQYNNYTFAIVQDRAVFIEKAIKNFYISLVLGAFFAFFALFAFLRDKKTPFIIGTAIPIAGISIFIPMYFLNVSINVISLSGLAMGLGMLLDNSIVVCENVFRHRQLGKSWSSAAYTGTNQVLSAITASTLTTLVVFAPLVLSRGVMSLLFREQALTVCISLLVSLFTSITLLPVMLAQRKIILPQNNTRKFEESLKKLILAVVTFCLQKKRIIIITYIIVILLSLLLIMTLPKEYFPQISERDITVSVFFPSSTKKSTAENQIRSIEKYLLGFKGINNLSIHYSEKSQNQLWTTFEPKTAYFTITLDKSVSSKDIINELRSYFQNYPLKIIIEPQQDFLGKLVNRGDNGIYLNIYGNNDEIIYKYTKELCGKLKEHLPNCLIETDLNNMVPIKTFVPDYSACAHYNITVEEIVDQLKLSYEGKKLSHLKKLDRDLKIQLSGADSLIHNKIIIKNGLHLPLSSLGSIQEENEPTKILHSGQNRFRRITILYSGALNEITKEINKTINLTKIPYGVDIGIEGQNTWFLEAMRSLSAIFLVSILLVYLIMSTQFESFFLPFIIILSIPLILPGVGLILYLTGTSFNVMSFMGIIVLGGIVVNNAILLVDFAEKEYNLGNSPQEAVVLAVQTRLRPIMMTTFTTIMGLLPLCFNYYGFGSMQANLSITILGGMLFSTPLTLIIIPIFFIIFKTKKVH